MVITITATRTTYESEIIRQPALIVIHFSHTFPQFCTHFMCDLRVLIHKIVREKWMIKSAVFELNELNYEALVATVSVRLNI